MLFCDSTRPPKHPFGQRPSTGGSRRPRTAGAWTYCSSYAGLQNPNGTSPGSIPRHPRASVLALTEPTGLRTQRYELLGEIGSGGQGVVHRAFDHWTQRPVAIKVLASKAAREPQAAERLSREQQALTALKGTAAVEVLDIYRGSEGELCLVMELLKGTTLDAYLQEIEARNERMELFRVAEIFDPI